MWHQSYVLICNKITRFPSSEGEFSENLGIVSKVLKNSSFLSSFCLPLVKRTITFGNFFSKFLIILAKSFENWPFFPWKTESWPFSSELSMFSRYFSKKFGEFDQFFQNLQNFSKINLFWMSQMSKWTGLLIFSKWTGLYWICQIFGNLENYRSDFGRKSSEKTEMISVKFDNLEEMSKWTGLFE